MKPTNIKPFKSQLAAKQALTKAERVWIAASRTYSTAYQDALLIPNSNPLETRDQAARSCEIAADHCEAIMMQAESQGFRVYSYNFSPNATRDLIQANID